MSAAIRINFIGALFVSVLSGSVALAESENAPRVVAGSSLKVATFQEIPGFWERLLMYDTQNQILSADNDWFAMADADIWVFFLKDRGDAAMLPPVARGVLEKGYEGGPIHVVVATLERNRVQYDRMMHFTFLDDFSDKPIEMIGCRAAETLAAELGLAAQSEGIVDRSSCFFE